jgi:hypothetical protein
MRCWKKKGGVTETFRTAMRCWIFGSLMRNSLPGNFLIPPYVLLSLIWHQQLFFFDIYLVPGEEEEEANYKPAGGYIRLNQIITSFRSFPLFFLRLKEKKRTTPD